ncbi:unnamed protein product [Durusdinium trenchii]|uniref:Uncharacterized protein n=1 Tax=Durusdinium trenchii TaxID=1381693 RepID=A0ABP0N9D6_9DINO
MSWTEMAMASCTTRSCARSQTSLALRDLPANGFGTKSVQRIKATVP